MEDISGNTKGWKRIRSGIWEKSFPGQGRARVYLGRLFLFHWIINFESPRGEEEVSGVASSLGEAIEAVEEAFLP